MAAAFGALLSGGINDYNFITLTTLVLISSIASVVFYKKASL